MLFLHSKCGGGCDIDMSSFISIVGKPYVHQKGALSAKNIKITTSKAKDIKNTDVRFICDVCAKTVDENDVYAVCGYCKKSFSLGDLFSNKESGELICKPCDKKHFDKRTAVPVSKLVKQVVLD